MNNLSSRVARLESADLGPDPEDVLVVIHRYSNAPLNSLQAPSGHRIERGMNESEEDFIRRAQRWHAESGHEQLLHGVK